MFHQLIIIDVYPLQLVNKMKYEIEQGKKLVDGLIDLWLECNIK